jgi:putative flippase GtrA
MSLPRSRKADAPSGSQLAETATEVSRFTVVGILATLTYLIASNAMMFLAGMNPVIASVGAYLLGMIVSFFGQSRITFRVGQVSLSHYYRFAVLSFFGLLFSYLSVILVVDYFGQHPFWATIATVVIIPAASYVIMKVWVFASR